MTNSFTPDDLKKFIHDHIQNKIDHGELGMTFKLDDDMCFEEQIQLYETTMLEGLVNGIMMCGGEVKGIKIG